MKTHVRFIALASLLVGATLLPACSNFVDVQPVTEIPRETALNTVAKFESAVAAVYSPLAENRFYGENLQIVGELMADNLDLTQGGYPNDPFVLRQTIIFTQQNRDIWSAGYLSISRGNILLKALDDNIEIQGATQALRNQWRGELLFLRALAHFELVRLWGRPFGDNPGTNLGVPLRTVAITANASGDPTPRATVAQVYTQVIADLQQAIPLLPANTAPRATRWAARAILARVYFNQNNHAAAYSEANEVITNGGFTMGAVGGDTLPFRNAGPGGTPAGGVIFQMVREDNPGASGRFRPGNNLPLSAQPTGLWTALQMSDVTDLRRQVGTNGTTLIDDLAGLIYSRKWSPVAPLNIPVIRLAELHLIRAESGAETGQTTPAQASFNAVRQFSVATAPNTALTGTALRDAVRTERRLELYQENSDRYHELRRTQQSVRGLAWNSQQLLLKIPDVEVNSNPAIIQN